ncbi:putative agc protein kinase protein [Botrytis fragariae]|uniref:non-specific serine/threonine protein kinase n=1 Tax=Botrytis fragariae TaxID=1964551 RepID=A0A8H6EG37_9HELO|nr:putative agc protein kinase protein [Botrytis fragariae]KAF5870645.1 putative agc protein kinase protein [Botrytis fragariae]
MEGDQNQAMLAPPAVSHLRAEAGMMERSLSADIREEREDLRQAAEETLNVIMDLSMEGTINWVSPSWSDVIGTTLDSVQGKPIADILIGDNDRSVFTDTLEEMKKDDSRSYIIRFAIELGPASRLLPLENLEHVKEGEGEGAAISQPGPATIDLEGQGIMVHDRGSEAGSHTMWMIRPWIAPREIQIDLAPVIVESLGTGAQVLAKYLTTVAEHGLDDPENHAPPLPLLCRICERQIPPWWFEKHTELCLQEHKAEMEVQMCQDNLTEHRHAIVRVLDALEARQARPSAGEQPVMPNPPQAEYKGLPIGANSTTSSGTASPGTPTSGRSRSRSTSGFGHARGRSFAQRRPHARIVELLLDLCDTAMEINTPAIKEPSPQAPGEFRTQSPQSESRISQVLQWQSPSLNAADQEGLSILCADSEAVARAKVEAVIRHRRIIEYSERIRMEFSAIVQDCIDEAINKAARLAAGQLSDSTEEPEEITPANEEGFFAGSFDGPHGPSSLAAALRAAEVGTGMVHEGRQLSSAAISSTRSSSPKECPTPRSHQGALSSILGQSREARRESIFFESDTGAESDGSVRSSSVMGRPPRTESPVSEFGDLRRHASSRQQNRRSMVLGTGTLSPRRQESPVRMPPPSSPLRISKPRILPIAHEGIVSPTASPMLPGSEFSSPALVPSHHRRQSSAAGSDPRPPPSPRLNSVNAPQARAVPPSIKDFEIIKPISKGAFGSVYLSKKKSTGDYYAIKVLKKADMVAKNQVTNVKAERAIMMWQGESDFVAKLYWTFSSKDYLYLVMEYLNGGDCASLIKVLGGLSEDWAKKYLGEVILGVEHLHSRGIVHRDLKPDNLLIDQKGHLKLTDFGLSRMGLIGRQKRVLSSVANESAPDLLKQGPFARATSMSSSRASSFDYQGHHSPGSTPQMTPDVAGSLGTPSYFNLSRENTINKDARRKSGHRSDSGGSDALTSMFNQFSLNESQNQQASNQRRTPIEELSENEATGSPDLCLHPITSHSSDARHSTPPQTSTGMMPPPMALFDPDDSNRRFVGTPDYLAPETVNGLGQDEVSDWWSVGCIMFEFIYGYPPFHAGTPDEVFENILARRISWPDEGDYDVSDEAKDLMNKLLCSDPQKRLGANKEEKFPTGGDEIRSHPWFEGTQWDKLLEDDAQFVPAPENPEDTEYFDARGATLQSFAEEMEDQASTQHPTPGAEYPERPHDALSRVRSQVNNVKRGLMPLHIPPHVRDMKSRRLSEPVVADDFGNFTFKNLPVLEKANKDVIQKLRQEAMSATSKPVVSPGGANTAVTSPAALDGSPVLPMPMPMPIQRTLSNAKATARPSSPSGFSQADASPSRASQPSSPLLVSFIAGQNNEARRKTSSNSSSLSQQSSNNLAPPASFMDGPRTSPGLHKTTSSAASSPIKIRGSAPPPLSLSSPAKPPATPRQGSGTSSSSRARSQTVGSQEGSPLPGEFLSHRKRRSQVFDMSPSSSDNEGEKANALLRVQRRRQSSRRMSQITLSDGPAFRPLDVLICEDHPVSRMVMEKLLEKLRCRTVTVSNGADALRYAVSDIKFDIIMMEFKLPQLNGADVARMIRETKNANSQTPIVAITGYLKELQAPHQFDALIEKPPTASKLTEVLCRLCQWKEPISSLNFSPAYPPPSGLRQESLRLEDSPTSASSGFAHMPAGSFRGSSREDSISSSLFEDTEAFPTDDLPVVINRRPTGDWDETGLGISNEVDMIEDNELPKLPPPNLLPNSPSPVRLEHRRNLSRQRSSEKMKAKREILEKNRHECAESGDDEDEVLGDVAVREKTSPKATTSPKTHRGSKLGTEMMRTNSRGSVVSGTEMLSSDSIEPPPTVTEEAITSSPTSEMPPASEISEATSTPPGKFQGPGDKEVDLFKTPKQSQSPFSFIDEEPTPRPTSKSSQTVVDEDFLPTPRPTSKSSQTVVDGDFLPTPRPTSKSSNMGENVDYLNVGKSLKRDR